MTRVSEPDPVDVYVGNRLRFRRKELGMSQAGLAEAGDISFQQIQKYERGSNRVSASMMVLLANHLHVSPGYFFEGAPGVRGSEGHKPSNYEDALALLATTPSAVEILKTMASMDHATRTHFIGLARVFTDKEEPRSSRMVAAE